ncbi:4-(cytidine 5'-diphospho)-2-C-methyl-D-erythritol kinase [Hellea balneolensis]|uniref:4-(cytidine 5'-diphospho)-2-C-methyl-D-erythritol kinase n=1 Tax=Hellea balneolensis TaxID=287478 RepID=UPI000406AEC9|nr:4-(cytidine 5'-diphospho)-2-C-methyl-D-erythritol kinase [Hellea balneolensis]
MRFLKEPAKAKINLTLHVGRIIKDVSDPFYGYHPLDSLVVFADIADEIVMSPAEVTALSIEGPFGASLTGENDNLILRALRAASAKPHQIKLTKNLPVSAGIGGGSANAAAVLRMCGVDDLHTAVSLGADVPVCLRSETAHMTGIGKDVTLMPNMGQLHAVLVNPGVAVSTGKIFKAFDAAPDIRETPRPMKQKGDLLVRALDGRNDLEPIAIAQAPIIGDVLRMIASQIGCQLARMSGSGATCFGVYENRTAARRAKAAIKAQAPDWWCEAVILGDK